MRRNVSSSSGPASITRAGPAAAVRVIADELRIGEHDLRAGVAEHVGDLVVLWRAS